MLTNSSKYADKKLGHNFIRKGIPDITKQLTANLKSQLKEKSLAMHVMNRSVSRYRIQVLSHTIQTLSRPQYAIFSAITDVCNAYNEKS